MSFSSRFFPLIALAVACAPAPEPVDGDGDGAFADADCDDADATVGPFAAEVAYDGVDNDCDPGSPDDDLDGDGHPLADDCDDADASVSPSATESSYDGVDDDCDADTPDDDLDGDGYPIADDCDDEDASVHPGAVEAPYDGIDDDCDPGTPDDDLDGDGHALADDCDDEDAAAYPGAGLWCRSLADAGLQLVGVTAGDQAGASVGLGGDLDGDGAWDVVVGAPGVDTGGADGGAVYLVPGDTRGEHSLASAGWSLTGPAGTRMGSAVAIADLSGDGQVDLLFGATGAEDEEYDGGVFLVTGPVTGATLWADAAETYSHAGYGLGTTIAAGPDVDGDGVGDAAYGSGRTGNQAFLAFGAAEGLTCGRRVETTTGDELGRAVALGDVTGDGLADLLVSDPSRDRDSGAVWVWDDLGAERDDCEGYLYEIYATRLWGVVSERLGYSLAAEADLTGDGYADVVAGAPSPAGGVEVSTYVFSGPIEEDQYSFLAAATLQTYESGSLAGWAAATADIDDDGNDDLVLGDPGVLSEDEGGAWVAYGPLTGTLSLGEAVPFLGADEVSARAGGALAVRPGGFAVGATEAASTAGRAWVLFPPEL